MKGKSILIVDDEKNIRLTLAQSLETLGLNIETAETGEEALVRIKEGEPGIVLLDLRLPGMDGMEVLRRMYALRPDIRIVVITAHGTIDTAIEAIKLGAVQFIQKPFSPQEIRDIVQKAMDRDRADESRDADYEAALSLAGKCIEEQQFDAAFEHLRKAMYLDHLRPEAFNLMGTVMELKRDLDEARRHYRAAYFLDPTYEPAAKNLDRVTSWQNRGSIAFGATKPQGKKTEQA